MEIERHTIRLPQLSVMTEMAEDMPSLWMPIPGMYGVSKRLDSYGEILGLRCLRGL